MAKINHDQLFKELLTTFFIEFLELFFPPVLEYLDTDSIQFVDKELFTDLVGGEKKILDIVALAKFQEQDYSFLVHTQLSTMELQEQEQIMQITTSWEQKGIVKGREEGQKEGQVATILRLLNRKLGNLPEESVTQIKSLEPNQLDTLTEDLLDFETFDDLNCWLSNS
jgi:Domain of unknown function (DUF4351)